MPDDRHGGMEVTMATACKNCDKPLIDRGGQVGRPAAYCTDACRKKAFRREGMVRQAAEDLADRRSALDAARTDVRQAADQVHRAALAGDGLPAVHRAMLDAVSRLLAADQDYRRTRMFAAGDRIVIVADEQAAVSKRHALRHLATVKKQRCADCGRSLPPYAMDFDHVRGEKLFNLARAADRPWTGEQIMEEIDKCDVVCAVCHRVRTMTRKKR